MFSKEVEVRNPEGLHARPATFFIHKANTFKSSVWVENGDRRAKNAMYIANNFEKALTTLLIGNNITHIAAGSVAVYLTPQNPRTLFVFIGISIIAAGITDVFTHIVFNRKVRIFKSGVTDTEETEDTKDSREAAENTLPDDTVEAVTGFEEEAVQQPVEEAVEEAVEVTAEETAEETTEEAADATD